jgi:hypothetical protein
MMVLDSGNGVCEERFIQSDDLASALCAPRFVRFKVDMLVAAKYVWGNAMRMDVCRHVAVVHCTSKLDPANG